MRAHRLGGKPGAFRFTNTGPGSRAPPGVRWATASPRWCFIQSPDIQGALTQMAARGTTLGVTWSPDGLVMPVGGGHGLRCSPRALLPLLQFSAVVQAGAPDLAVQAQR